MRINVFEGARRIALLLGAIWVIGVATFTVSDWERDTRVKIVFARSGPGQPWLRATPAERYSDCTFADASQSREFTTKGKTSVSATLCFKASKFKNNRMLVPYKQDGEGMWWGAGAYSDEVKAYTTEAADAFRLAMTDEEWADGQLWPTRWKTVRNAAGVLFGGLVLLWLFTAIFGWIVRGFLAIPKGQDRRPPEG